LLLYVLQQKAVYEEAALEARYADYAEYKARVKRFIPYLY
jgi:protein-S-isoprenylcysteine O-methyltransferase Ste14